MRTYRYVFALQLAGSVPFRVPVNDPRFPSGVLMDWQSYMPFDNNPWVLNPGTLRIVYLLTTLDVQLDAWFHGLPI